MTFIPSVFMFVGRAAPSLMIFSSGIQKLPDEAINREACFHFLLRRCQLFKETPSSSAREATHGRLTYGGKKCVKVAMSSVPALLCLH